MVPWDEGGTDPRRESMGQLNVINGCSSGGGQWGASGSDETKRKEKTGS